MKLYIFHRGDSWYPIELRDDKDAIKNAECNPGTSKVTDGVSGKVVWMPNDQNDERLNKNKQ